MTVLFLDVDGVLNSSRTAIVQKYIKGESYIDSIRRSIDPIAMGMVNRLIKEANLDVVISSSHRYEFLEAKASAFAHWYDEKKAVNGMIRHRIDIAELRDYFEFLGIAEPNRIISAIPDITLPAPHMGVKRGLEVQWWLKHYRMPGKPESEYVILDDTLDFFEGQMRYLAKTSMDEGFTYEAYRRAEEILKINPLNLVIPDLD